MLRSTIALLFLFVLVVQSATAADNRSGIRSAAATPQSSKLTESAEIDDPAEPFLHNDATVAHAQVGRAAFISQATQQIRQQTNQPRGDATPLYETCAVWRI